MSHKINICFDEWGVWSMSDVQVQKSVEDAPWQTAPAISEQIYTMEDALLFASMLMNFIKRADRVKIACQSLLTNISSCIMTEEDGGVWVQPVYYPFALMAKYAHGVTLDTRYTGDTYACSTFETVPCVDHVLVYDGQKHEVTVFFCKPYGGECRGDRFFTGHGAGDGFKKVLHCFTRIRKRQIKRNMTV